MQFAIPMAIAAATSAATIGAQALLTPKPKAAPAAPPPPNPFAARKAARSDTLGQRRGLSANQVTGPGGAEARTAGGKALLGQ